MSILEQHFYTDAGVSLPVDTAHEDQNNANKTSSSSVLKLNSKVDLKNATDDVKSNLQKINKGVVRLKISKSDSVINESCNINRNKRHSIAFSTHDHEQFQKKLQNRRSLSVMPGGDTSKIPVSFKGIYKASRSDSVSAVCSVNKLDSSIAKVTETTPKESAIRQKNGSSIPCFKSSLNSCNSQKTSGLPVLTR